MDITEVRIKKFESPQGKLLGVASVTFDNCFVVHNLRIVEGEKGVFVAMPSRQLPNSKFVDVAHPVTSEMRQTIQDAVLSKFKDAQASPAGSYNDDPPGGRSNSPPAAF